MNDDSRVPMRRVFGDHLVRLGEKHAGLVVLDADVSSSTQTRFFGERYPQRFINCGIAEANMVSVAAGIAAAGLRPVVSTFACLLATRALDQIRSQVAYPRLPVVLAGGYSGLSDFADGASHQSIEDLAVLTAMPNMTVLCPGDATETELALEAALEHDGPVYLRLSRAEVPRLPVPGGFSLGKAVIRRDGGDVALLSTGQMLEFTLEAADLLEKEGIHSGALGAWSRLFLPAVGRPRWR
jgi:transketolase